MSETSTENSDPNSAGPSAPTVVRRRGSHTLTYAVVAIIVLAAILGAVAYQQKWFGGTTAPVGSCATGTTLQGNGATYIASLASTWVADYHTAKSNTVNYVAGGSGTGITDFTAKTVDFAATDDPLTASQRTALPGTALTLPITAGALAVIYNVPGVPTGLKLSGSVLANIYLGTITSWNDTAITSLNPGVSLPSATIITVHRSDSAGTTFVLTDYLTQDSTSWASSVGKGTSVAFPKAPTQDAIKGNSALLTYVQTTPDTIGYAGLSDVLASTTATTYASMQNPSSQYVTPTLASTTSAIADKSAVTTFPASDGDWLNVSMVNAPGASDYPLATFAYFFVYEKTDLGFTPSLVKSQVLVQWLHWVLDAGQSDAAGLNFVALAPSVVSLDNAGISTMTYNGAPIPACS